MKHLNKKGFRILAALLVVAGIVLVTSAFMHGFNPTAEKRESFNAQRREEVTRILTAVYQYTIDNNTMPAGITTTATEICATGATSCTGLVDLSVLTASQKYLVTIPVEPQKKTTNGAGYLIMKTPENQVTVMAQYPDDGVTISIAR